ncbi:MAG TPA: hypothetical protein VF546_09425 [Pyrinomonadaceae bacterium]|jgi:hypothetical protein
MLLLSRFGGAARPHARRLFFVVAAAWLALPPGVAGQRPRRQAADAAAADWQRHANLEDALRLLPQLANELRSEDDTAAAARLQAQAADLLWKFDEPAARAIFREAYDALLRALDEGGRAAGAEAGVKARRQAAALMEVLRRFGTHDGLAAEDWRRRFERAGGRAPGAPEMSPSDVELLAQLALELAADDPPQALQLGLRALRGLHLPEGFGRLLFALSRSDKALSDALLQEAVAALRRQGYPYSPALVPLSNYVFDAQGQAFTNSPPANVQAVTGYLLDAAAAQALRWRNLRLAGGTHLPPPDAQLYLFLSARALPIISSHAPDKLQTLLESLHESSAGLSQEEARAATEAGLAQQRAAASEGLTRADIDTRVAQAEREPGQAARDELLRRIAVDALHSDRARALAVAERISDARLRARTEDDIRLLIVADRLRAGSYDEARPVILKLNDTNLKARTLAQLADRALAQPRDLARAGELLAEAYAIAAKGDNDLDKVLTFLAIAEKFAKYDPARGFELLAAASKLVNQLPSDAFLPLLAPAQDTRDTVRLIVAVGGREFTTGARASIDALDLTPVQTFAELDYQRTRMLGDAVSNKLVRAKFLLASAGYVLRAPAPPRRPAAQ